MSEKRKFIRGFATRAIHGSDIAKGEHMPVSTQEFPFFIAFILISP